MQEIFKLCEIEEMIVAMDMPEIDDDIALTEDENEVVISGWYVYIPELNLRLHEGIVGIWDEEMKVYMPDFSVTVLFEGKSNNTDYLYFEQGGFVSTVANWFSGKKDFDEIEQLPCELVIPKKVLINKDY